MVCLGEDLNPAKIILRISSRENVFIIIKHQSLAKIINADKIIIIMSDACRVTEKKMD